MRFLMFILLAMSGASIWVTLGQTPAFNPNALGDTVVGNGRVALNEAMYDPGSYAFQRGFGYLMADALFSGETESRDVLAAENLATERAELAQTAIEESLNIDPGNAHAWAALGWALLRQGEAENAVDALRVSWEIAPYNRTLAITRLNLAGVLSDPDIADTALLQAQKKGIMRDAIILEKYDEQLFVFQKELSPKLFLLIDFWKSG